MASSLPVSICGPYRWTAPRVFLRVVCAVCHGHHTSAKQNCPAARSEERKTFDLIVVRDWIYSVVTAIRIFVTSRDIRICYTYTLYYVTVLNELAQCTCKLDLGVLH